MTEHDYASLNYEAAGLIRSLAGSPNWNIREDSRKLVIYALADLIYSPPVFDSEEFQEGFADTEEITAVQHWAFDLLAQGRADLADYLEKYNVRKKWKAQPFLVEEN